MSTTSPSDLSASAILAQMKAGAYPRELMATIARGFLPLPQDDLIAVLSYMSDTADQEIAELARASLSEIPTRTLHAFATNENLPSEHLDMLTRATLDPSVLEALIRNRAVSDNAIIDLAKRGDTHVQEVIVINQARIIRAPQILDALLENPRISTEARRRALENREEFFEKKKRLEELKRILGEQETIDEAAPNDAISDLLDQVHDDKAAPTLRDQGEITVEGLEEEKKQSVWALLLKMTVSEKVQLAFKGDKTVRMILVRDRNRIVATAAIRNPRMSESEVESIAGMRNVEEEILRFIGHRRDWTSKYPIAISLVKNPKAPVGVVLPLINRLTLRDLKGLKDDKGVSEAVRANARKLYQARQKT